MAALLQKAGQDGERCFCCNKLPVLLGLRQVFIGLHSQDGTKMKYGTFPSFFFILLFSFLMVMMVSWNQHQAGRLQASKA